MSKTIVYTKEPENSSGARDPIKAFEEEAERQLKQYYPIHTRQEHWDSLTKLNWRKYRHEVKLPSSRWREEIQLGMHGQLSFYLRGTYRLLHYRSEPTPGPGSGRNDDETASTERLSTDKTRDDLSRLVSSAGSGSTVGLDLGRDGIGIQSMRGDTRVGDTGSHGTDSLASSQYGDEMDGYSTSTDSCLTESDEEDEDQPCGQITIQIQFSGGSESYASHNFVQLGLITAREQADEKGPESHAEWPTGYHLAVKLDNEYKPATVWFISTTSHKSAKNKYISPSSRQMPHFAAAQVASSLGEMNELHALELAFVNKQEEYTLKHWV